MKTKIIDVFTLDGKWLCAYSLHRATNQAAVNCLSAAGMNPLLYTFKFRTI